MKYLEKIVDITTGEETIVEREETAADKKLREQRAKEFAAREAEAQAKAAQRQALLSRLGITEEEARILLGGN